MGLPPTVRPRLQLLYVGDAELARQCLGRPGGSIHVVEALPSTAGFPPVPADRPLPFDILLIEHGHSGSDALAILKRLGSIVRHIPVIVVAEWDEELAAAALTLGASDYVSKSRASFRAVYFRLHRLRAHAALLAERSRINDSDAARERSGSERAELVRQLTEQQAARRDAEQRLSEAVANIKQTREERFTDAIAAAW